MFIENNDFLFMDKVAIIGGMSAITYAGSLLRTPPRILALETVSTSPTGLSGIGTSPPMPGNIVVKSPQTSPFRRKPRRDVRKKYKRRSKYVRPNYYRKFIKKPSYYRLPK